MEYEILYDNADGTSKVRLTVAGHVLEQDFANETLDVDVRNGMAIMAAELERNTPIPLDTKLVGQVVMVDVLPEIPAEDFEQEQPLEAIAEA